MKYLVKLSFSLTFLLLFSHFAPAQQNHRDSVSKEIEMRKADAQ